MTTRKEHVKDSQVFTEPLSIADVLESHRECEELKRSEIATILGMTRQQYNNIVTGKDPVSVAKAAVIAKILEQPEEVFIKIALNDLLRRNDLAYEVEKLHASI